MTFKEYDTSLIYKTIMPGDWLNPPSPNYLILMEDMTSVMFLCNGEKLSSPIQYLILHSKHRTLFQGRYEIDSGILKVKLSCEVNFSKNVDGKEIDRKKRFEILIKGSFEEENLVVEQIHSSEDQDNLIFKEKFNLVYEKVIEFG